VIDPKNKMMQMQIQNSIGVIKREEKLEVSNTTFNHPSHLSEKIVFVSSEWMI